MKDQPDKPAALELQIKNWAIESAINAIAIADLKGNLEYVNPAFLKLWKYATAAEVLGRSGAEFWPAATELNEAVQVYRATGGWLGELTAKARDGSLFHVQVSASVIKNVAGEPIRMMASFVDISERKQTEEKLRKTIERLDLATSAAHLGIWDWDIQKNELVWDDRMYQLYGIKREKFAGAYEAWLAGIHPDDRRASDEVSRQAQRGEREYDTEFRVVWPDGTIRHLRAYAVIVRDPAGKPLRMTGTNYDITEHKQAEEAFRQSNEKFTKVFRTSPDSITITRLADGTYLEVNQSFTDTTGYTPEEVLGRSSLPGGAALWASKEDRDRLVSVLLSRGEVFGGEASLRLKNGAIRTALLSARILELGGEKCILTIARDISERKRMEEALHESEQRHKMVSELATDYVFKLGVATDGKVTMDFVSENFYALTGRSRQDALTVETWSNIIHPDDLGKIMGLLQQLIVTPRTAELECRSYIHGRKQRWINVVARSEWDAKENRVTAIVGAVKDITERKQTEEVLHQSEQKYRDLANSLPLAIYELDASGRLGYVNRTALEWFGYTEADLAEGINVPQLVVEADRQRAADSIRKVIATGETVSSEYSMTRKDGSVFSVLSASRPIVRGGVAVGVRGTLLDITERKNYESVLNNAQRIESLGVFAGGIAHDFNNMLAGIFGLIDLARSVSKEAAPREYLEATLATMNRARALTQQLLTFAKGGAPVQKITPLTPFIQEAVQFALSGSQLACKYDIAEDLWPCNIDKNQIGQVIDNIVINAQQAMPNGGAIEISARNIPLAEREHPRLARGEYVKVSIKDFGIGIPKDILPHIFDPFYTTKTKGHGLGLATCYSIINRHGGCIDVESEPGKGSTFHVYLPASSEAVAADALSLVAHKGSGTILVVDDEEVVRDVIRKMCETLGYTVVCRSDGREALELYLSETKANRPFAALILDLTIRGGMGGLETVAEIRKLTKELPVFVVSGYANNAVMKNPVEFGFTASIFKPFTIAELSEMLSKGVIP
jgi:PAS domain S-box-containing protein